MRFLGVPVEFRASVSSTNDEILRRAADGAPEGLVIAADQQTAGRGRQGRSWWDAPGNSLLFSVLLRPSIPLARFPLLGIAMACAVAEAGSEAAGRNPKDVDMMIEMKVSFDTDAVRAVEDTRHWAALALSPEEKLSVEDPLEMERLADQLPSERAARRWIVSTDPDEHVEKIRPYIDMGFRHLVFHAPGPDQARFLDLYADQVLPRLRAAFD